MAINLRCYFFAAQAVMPGMQAAGGGSIINFSSISYMMADYRLCRLYHREFRHQRPDAQPGARVRPGPHPRQRGGARLGADREQKDLWVTPEGLAAHLARQCLKDPLEPEDMVGGVLFLASKASRMMTGQALVIDGGVVVTRMTGRTGSPSTGAPRTCAPGRWGRTACWPRPAPRRRHGTAGAR